MLRILIAILFLLAAARIAIISQGLTDTLALIYPGDAENGSADVSEKQKHDDEYNTYHLLNLCVADPGGSMASHLDEKLYCSFKQQPASPPPNLA